MSSPLRIAPPADPRPHVEDAGPFVKMVGGWACLDFVNTVQAWLPPETPSGVWRVEGERLETFRDLVAWAEVSGVVDAVGAVALAAAAAAERDGGKGVVARAHGLRATIRALAGARVEGVPVPEDALAELQAAVRSLSSGERLVDEGGVVSTWWVTERPEPEAVLWPVARSALALLGDPDATARLGRCDGERCGWLFVDVSRGRRRRWCHMGDCGNVAKVRAHRASERRARRSGGPRS